MEKNIKPLPPPLPFQTPGEEAANSILHGAGILLSTAGLVLLVLRARGYLGGSGKAPAQDIACYCIYSSMMISMFLASTLYHAIQHEGAKRVFRILDHSGVFLLIAGTYTPYSLIFLKGALGWVYFGIEWALAITGTALYAAKVKFLRRLELGVYILMGWAIALALWKLYRQIPRRSFILLFLGGLAYTIGVFWYKRPYRRAAHAIWHVHVIIGAACHWFSLFLMC
jgi:hemolysin III